MTDSNYQTQESTLISQIDDMRQAAQDLKGDAEYQRAHQIWLSLWHLCKQQYGENSVESIDVMLELAESFFDLGDDEAAGIFRDAVSRSEQFLGPNHTTTGHSYQGLANMLSYSGKCSLAEPLMRKALEIQTLNFGLEHDQTARHLHDLGLMLMRNDDYDEAEVALRESLRIFECVNDADDLNNSRAMHTLGHTLYLSGKLEEAQCLLEKVVRIREMALGARHPDLAMSLRMLGDIMDDGHSPRLAKPLYVRALSIYEEFFEFDHPQVIHSLLLYAEHLEKFDELEEALGLFRRIVDIKERNPDAAGTSIEKVQRRVRNLQKKISTLKSREHQH